METRPTADNFDRTLLEMGWLDKLVMGLSKPARTVLHSLDFFTRSVTLKI